MRSFKKMIKLKFSSKSLSSRINISFTYARAAKRIHKWLKCYMPLV